jgi:anti-sigma factor RsiW
MNCTDREKVFAYTHHMLAPAEEAEVARHLEACAECRTAAAEYGRLDTLLDEWKPAEASAAFDVRLRSVLSVAGARQGGLFGLRWMPVLAPALVLLVFFVAVWVVRDRARESRTPAAPRAAMSAPNTPPAVQAETKDEKARSELAMFQNLSLLEDYDMLNDFDVLSELPRGGKKVEN